MVDLSPAALAAVPRVAVVHERGGGEVSVLHDPDFTPPPDRIVVTGGRHFGDAALVERALRCFANPGDIIVQGGAMGVDDLARQWARANGCEVQTYAAEWSKYGPQAGPIRNREMLVKSAPRIVVAFPGGRGTANCIHQARVLGIHVEVITPDFKPAKVQSP